ncbi:hypothetical protein M0R04_04250 [Candidatus Dojkabacteria bacterium]|jgi:hypothetical protein|nr:hypothetical protein [Candidatus Dojkabacteria bacterium]
MPTYIFYNTETNEEFEDVISYSDKVSLLKKNPHIRAVPAAFSMVATVGGIDSKTDDTWKEVLSKVAEAHPESPVGERYNKKSIKDVKTKEIIQKHRDKWKNR